MSKSALHTLAVILKEFSHYKFDNGEITGFLVLSQENLKMLKALSENRIVENYLIVNNSTISLDSATSYFGTKVQVTAYSKQVPDGAYYDSENDFVAQNQYELPTDLFYIRSIDFYSENDQQNSAISKVNDIHQLIKLMIEIADVVIDETDNTKKLILFQKRKIVVPIVYNQNQTRNIEYLGDLFRQLTTSHDKEERVSIFKSEIVTFLYDTPEQERFGKLVTMLDVIYDNYLKSHLLYLEKFSYHDLKSEVDADKLDFTKKIYATVNDIQTKLIAVPAAFLLVLSQFDFTGQADTKNLFIAIASLLFSGLLEILLRNQFGVLNYIETEITDLKNELSNKDTKVNLSEFITSFSDLQPLIRTQRKYLWVFRCIVWLISIVSIFMLFYFKK